MGTLMLDYITLQTIKTYPYFKTGLNFNRVLLFYTRILILLLVVLEEVVACTTNTMAPRASTAAKVLQMQLRCKSIFAQKSSRSTSFRAQQNFDDDDGWKGKLHSNSQLHLFLHTHTHWVKIREKNWKIWVKIHTGLKMSFILISMKFFVSVLFFGGNLPYNCCLRAIREVKRP